MSYDILWESIRLLVGGFNPSEHLFVSWDEYFQNVSQLNWTLLNCMDKNPMAVPKHQPATRSSNRSADASKGTWMIGVPWGRRIVVVQSHDTQGWVLHRPWQIRFLGNASAVEKCGKTLQSSWENPWVLGVSGFDVHDFPKQPRDFEVILCHTLVIRKIDGETMIDLRWRANVSCRAQSSTSNMAWAHTTEIE